MGLYRVESTVESLILSQSGLYIRCFFRQKQRMNKITIHIGAHRCASTAIQNLLIENRRSLKNQGVDLLLRGNIGKKEHTQVLTLLKKFSFYNLRIKWLLRRFAKAFTGADHLVISEENILGTMAGVKENNLYPNSANVFKGLKYLRDIMGADMRLVLMTRPQDRLIESIYHFRVTRGEQASFKDFVTRLDLDSFHWDRIIANAEAVGLGGCLHVGSVESLSLNLVNSLSGLGLTGELSGNSSLSPANVNLWRAMVQMGVSLQTSPMTRELLFYLRELKEWPRKEELYNKMREIGIQVANDQISMSYDIAQTYDAPLFSDADRKKILERYKHSNAKTLDFQQAS